MSDSSLHAKIDALARENQHMRESMREVGANHAEFVDTVRREVETLREVNLDLHKVVARVEERLIGFSERVAERMADHSEDLRREAVKVSAILLQQVEDSKERAEAQRQISAIRAWSAGAAAVLTVIGAVIAWLVGSIPAHAWTVLIGGGG